ncbi:unknown [Prevotella sp. CAG:5226]|nr:unknown [Prevotella sp. CAG:5226]
MGSRKGALSITFTVLPFTNPISTIRLRKPPCPATFTITPLSPVCKSESFINNTFLFFIQGAKIQPYAQKSNTHK